MHYPKIILASGSPRRKSLLNGLGVEFESIAPNVDETLDLTLTPTDMAKSISRIKAEEVAKSHMEKAVIAADTVVEIYGLVLGKPKSEEDAFNMLKKLSGSWHMVHTGISIYYNNKKTVFSETTRVHFRALDDEFVRWYISTGEPMDKAGAYGIQGFGAVMVDRIDGDFYNVMGFPIAKIMQELSALNIYNLGRD